MSAVVDLIAYDIAIAEASEDEMKAFAWYDRRTNQWRRKKRDGKGRYPVHARAWPSTWTIVGGATFQVALFDPFVERICRQSQRGGGA